MPSRAPVESVSPSPRDKDRERQPENRERELDIDPNNLVPNKGKLWRFVAAVGAWLQALEYTSFDYTQDRIDRLERKVVEKTVRDASWLLRLNIDGTFTVATNRHLPEARRRS